MTARDWVAEARAVAAVSKDAAAALDALETDVPREWRETVIAALLCSPRSVALQTALEETRRWTRWRAVLPHGLAITFLTLCHPPTAKLACSVCEKAFVARDGVIAPLMQMCVGCLSLRRSRPRLRCQGCGGKAMQGLGFCRVCDPQIAGLLKQRPPDPPVLPRGLHEMVRRRR